MDKTFPVIQMQSSIDFGSVLQTSEMQKTVHKMQVSQTITVKRPVEPVLTVNIIHRSRRRLTGVLFSALLPLHNVKPYHTYEHDHGHGSQNPDPQQTPSRCRRSLRSIIIRFDRTHGRDGKTLTRLRFDAFGIVLKYKSLSAGALECSKQVFTLLITIPPLTFIDVQAEILVPDEALGTVAGAPGLSVAGAFLFATVQFALPGVFAVWDVSPETGAFITPFDICALVLTGPCRTAFRALENGWIGQLLCPTRVFVLCSAQITIGPVRATSLCPLLIVRERHTMRRADLDAVSPGAGECHEAPVCAAGDPLVAPERRRKVAASAGW